MTASFSPGFHKRIKRVPTKVRQRFKVRLALFLEDPYNQLLRNHILVGKFSGYRSINITGDWRAVFQLSGSDAYFVEIGTHSYLYG